MFNEKNILTFNDWMLYSNANIMGYNFVISPNDIRSIDFEFKCFETYNNGKFCIEDCYLQLRDISQLTENEKKYIHENYLIGVELNYDVEWNNLNDLLIHVFDDVSNLNFSRELIDYLRKNNIMIEKDDWFKMGKAIKI